MIELTANNIPANLVSLTLTQDGDQVDIRANGDLIGFFEVTQDKIKLQLCTGLENAENLDGLFHLNKIGQIVAQ